jgi:hypothetical protein
MSAENITTAIVRFQAGLVLVDLLKCPPRAEFSRSAKNTKAQRFARAKQWAFVKEIAPARR